METKNKSAIVDTFTLLAIVCYSFGVIYVQVTACSP